MSTTPFSLPVCLPACLCVCLPVYLSVCACRVLFQQCMLLHYVSCRLACLVVQSWLGDQICLLKAGMAEAGSSTGSALHHLHEMKYCPPYLILSDATKSHDLHALVTTCTLHLLLVCMLASLLCIVCNYSTAQHLSCIMSDADGSGWSFLEGATI